MADLTPEQYDAWEHGKLDCRCRSCGATSAATSRCFKYGAPVDDPLRCTGDGRDLEYRTHSEQGRIKWCEAPMGTVA